MQLTYALEGRHRERIAAMQSYVMESVDLEARILMLGLFDQFSRPAIRWKAAILTGLAPSEVRVDDRPRRESYGHLTRYGDAGGDPPAVDVLRAVAAGGYYQQKVVIHRSRSLAPDVAAAATALRGLSKRSERFDGWQVDIFDVESK